MEKNDVLLGVGSLILVLVLVSLLPQGEEQETEKIQEVQQPAVLNETATFRGTLPCADCPGIETTLTLSNVPGMTEGTYVLKEQYLNQGNTETTGKWVASVGNKKNPKATILVLTPKDSTSLRNFLKVNVQELIMLDGNRNGIPSKQNLTLVKQP